MKLPGQFGFESGMSGKLGGSEAEIDTLKQDLRRRTDEIL